MSNQSLTGRPFLLQRQEQRVPLGSLLLEIVELICFFVGDKFTRELCCEQKNAQTWPKNSI